MKKNTSTLAAGLKAAAGQKNPINPAPETNTNIQVNKTPKTVLIGGHYTPEVRRTLLLVQAERENTGKNLKQLLGEAINDLCAKYGKPQPYSGES